MHPIPRHSADPGAAVWANQPDVRPPAIGDALQRARLHPAEPERPFRDHDAQRERAARQALAIGAVARIDQLRLFGDLIADRVALAAAGLRELHRRSSVALWEGWCPGAELNHRHTDFQSVALPTELPGRLPAAPYRDVAAGCPAHPLEQLTGQLPAPIGREFSC